MKIIHIKGLATGSFKLDSITSSGQTDVYDVKDLYVYGTDLEVDPTLGNNISSLTDRTEFDRYEVPPFVRKSDFVIDLELGNSVYEVQLQDLILYQFKEVGDYLEINSGMKIIRYESRFVAKLVDWNWAELAPANVSTTTSSLLPLINESNTPSDGGYIYSDSVDQEMEFEESVIDDPSGSNVADNNLPNKDTPNNWGSCLSNIVWVLGLSILALSFLGTHGSSYLLGFIFFALLALFIFRIRSFLWTLLKFVVGIALIVWSLALLIELIDESQQTRSGDSSVSKLDNKKIDDPIILKDDENGDILKRVHSWKDYLNKGYSGEFKVLLEDVEQSSSKRKSFASSKGGIGVFSELYNSITNYPESELKMIQEMYTELVIEGSVPRTTFAEMIVTSVQNIPYFLVHEYDCMQSSSSSRVSAEFHQENGSEFCLPNVAFGLTTPTEFVRTFKGDCDTRALFLYNVLARLGYDVAILVSEQYGHAVLGINLPYDGKRIRSHSGKTYVAWETTSSGWKPGQLDPTVGDMKFWKIAIQSQP